MNLTDEDRTALARVLTWRRDVRHFRTDPVPEALMERLAAAVDRAPSVGNARPWRFQRIRDAGLRAKVRVEFARCNAEASQGYDAETQAEYARLKLAGLDAAPEQIAVFTVTDPEEGRGLGRRTMPQTLRQSTAMAIHTLWLAARAENLGLGMVSILDPDRMQTILAAPPGWEFSAYLCLGWPDFTDDTPLLHRVGWQENRPTKWDIR